ncbi:MAG: SDR family NAD(P)-dependent oxidoreductase [Ktedonobacterales bacterium]|nr:SDR family NAD(P)-dependent oxidoreductase [Ktedonobacterales bacterium]
MSDHARPATLRGHVALVTDGGRGLGAAIALALAAAGATVATLAHESCELTAVAAMLRLGGHQTLGVTAPDYADAAAVAEAIDAARDYLGPITILVDVVGLPTVLADVLPDMAAAGWGCFITSLPAAAPGPGIAWLQLAPTAPPEATAAQVRDFCLAALPPA